MNWNRFLSLIVYIVYLVAAILFAKGMWPIAFFALMLPLGCIWFGEELGEYIGFAGRMYISQTSPGIFIQFLGWIFLLMPACVLYFWH